MVGVGFLTDQIMTDLVRCVMFATANVFPKSVDCVLAGQLSSVAYRSSVFIVFSFLSLFLLWIAALLTIADFIETECISHTLRVSNTFAGTVIPTCGRSRRPAWRFSWT